MDKAYGVNGGKLPYIVYLILELDISCQIQASTGIPEWKVPRYHSYKKLVEVQRPSGSGGDDKNACSARCLTCSRSHRHTNPAHEAYWMDKDNIAPDEDLWIIYLVQVHGSEVLFAVRLMFPRYAPRIANICPNTSNPRSLLSGPNGRPTKFWLRKPPYLKKQVHSRLFSPTLLCKSAPWGNSPQTAWTSDRPSDRAHLNLRHSQNHTIVSVFLQHSDGFETSWIRSLLSQ
jgi:hypothetical protein